LGIEKQSVGVGSALKRIRVKVSGRVQGVGFRPTVYRYAIEHGLTGFVRNAPSGVEIEVEGLPQALTAFIAGLQDRPPRQAIIEQLIHEDVPALGDTTFQIVPSEGAGDLVVGIPPDLATCDDCVRELLDPNDRRYRYPFINCTNCGPRFTIARSLPYDRCRTSMESFELCPECAAEYGDPSNRRFDAQPNACPACGPRLSLLNTACEPDKTDDPLAETIRLLGEGITIAVKSLGGYHLCCDARSDEAVRQLRERKGRRDKPFAVMFGSLNQVRDHCNLSEIEEGMLTSFAAPIVILNRREDSDLSRFIAPDTKDVGAFLPYTPLHHLLLSRLGPLVMTSCNLSEEPISQDEDDLRRIMERVADYALTHNRPIVHRCDDSVVKVVGDRHIFYRRSRGWVPGHIELPLDGPAVFATGAELKSTFCITRGRQAFLSQHIGDLTEYESMRFYAEAASDLTRLLQNEPQCIAHDLHPAYESTRYAKAKQGVELVPVQHHHAHIASCMVDNGLNEPVIGVALDGTGLGDDGSIWGGEFLVADYASYRRVAHLKQYPMPGGDEAVLHPDRMAMSCLVSEFGERAGEIAARYLPSLAEGDREVLVTMLRKGIRSPLTSSAGRLFDAVSALLGICMEITYEGQAAIRLQTAAGVGTENSYEFELDQGVLSFGPMFRELVKDLDSKVSNAEMAAKFHRTVSVAVAETCHVISGKEGLKKVVLSGGVFQNDLLLKMTLDELNERGLQVYCHSRVPPNDGGLSLGQAAIALAKIQR